MPSARTLENGGAHLRIAFSNISIMQFYWKIQQQTPLSPASFW